MNKIFGGVIKIYCSRSTTCRVGLRADTVSCHVIADKLNC